MSPRPATRAYLAACLADTLSLLADTAESDEALYFFHLVLFHEDMHREASISMAQALYMPATHLTWKEADAWCRCAGHRLPNEVEWEMATLTQPEFHWSDVWEWTASRFLLYPDFAAHRYRDYSTPGFGERYVLRCASRATSPRLAHARHCNYFTPERNDLHNGFRSCAA